MARYFLTILIIVLIGLAGWYYFLQQGALVPATPEKTQNETNITSEGRVIFGVTDAAASMKNISSIVLTVSKVQANSATQGWVNVSSDIRQYDLLKLKASGAVELLSDIKLKADTYNQIRLTIDKVEVVASGKTQEAKLPSKDLKLAGKIVVEEGKTSAVTLDFIADKSLHVTGNGMFIFTPVLKLESESNVQANITGNVVKLTGGNAEADTTLGMDLNGEIKENFQLDANASLDILGNVIRIKGKSESDTGVKVTAQQAIDATISGGNLNVALSIKLVTRDGKKVWQVSGTKGLLLTNVYIDTVTGAVIATD